MENCTTKERDIILDSKGGTLDHPSHFDPRRNCLLVIAFAMIPRTYPNKRVERTGRSSSQNLDG